MPNEVRGIPARRQTFAVPSCRLPASATTGVDRPRRQTRSAVTSETTRAAPANSRGQEESEPLSAWAVAGVASTFWSALLLAVVPWAGAVADSASAGVRTRVGAGCSGSTDLSADTSFQLTMVPSEYVWTALKTSFPEAGKVPRLRSKSWNWPGRIPPPVARQVTWADDAVELLAVHLYRLGERAGLGRDGPTGRGGRLHLADRPVLGQQHLHRGGARSVGLVGDVERDHGVIPAGDAGGLHLDVRLRDPGQGEARGDPGADDHPEATAGLARMRGDVVLENMMESRFVEGSEWSAKDEEKVAAHTPGRDIAMGPGAQSGREGSGSGAHTRRAAL